MERYDLPAEKLATPEELGMLRVATETDEKNCGCKDAAITPSNLHNLLGSRKANTAYKGNEIVACPYQPGLLLKCTQAGTTSANSLNTTSVTVGQVITDGGVKWKVINPVDEQRPIKTFTSLEQIGLTNTASESDIAEKLPAYSMLYLRMGAGSSPADYPNFSLKRDVSVVVQKGSGVNDIDFTAISYVTDNVRFFKAVYTTWVDPKFSGWKAVFDENSIATKAQAEEGKSNANAMTPLRVLEAINALSPVKSVNGQTGDVNISTLPTGTVIPYLGQNAPNGFLSCNGAGLRSTTYTGLFNVIGTAFGSGNGVNTDFNLPNLNKGSSLEGRDIVGVVKEAGLPNILGTYSAGGGVGASWLRDLTGAFADTAMSGSNARSHSVTSGTGDLRVSFDASKSNAIYGTSDTVQPKAVTIKLCIKY